MKKILFLLLITTQISFGMDDPIDLVPLYGDYYTDNTTVMSMDQKARTWFVIAALKGDLGKMQEFRKDVKDINEPIYVGVRLPPIWNALACAIIGNHPNIVRYLIDQGVDINRIISVDMVLGAYFEKLWGVPVPQFIFDVQKNAKLRDSLKPLQLAEKLGYYEIVDILKNPTQRKPVTPVQPLVPQLPLQQQYQSNPVVVSQPSAKSSSSLVFTFI